MKHIFKNIFLNIKRFLYNQEGVNIIEFAFMLPVLLILLFGMVDLSRYYQFHQKMDNAAYTLNNLIAQNYVITKSEIDTYAATIPYLLKPFDTKNLKIITTCVKRANTSQDPLGKKPPYSQWQVEYGTASNMSQIVTAVGNQIVYLPNFQANQEFTLEQGDEIIITEIYLPFEFTFASTSFYKAFNIPSDGIYKKNIMRPRYNHFQNKDNKI
jgi:hypothetical protein